MNTKILLVILITLSFITSCTSDDISSTEFDEDNNLMTNKKGGKKVLKDLYSINVEYAENLSVGEIATIRQYYKSAVNNCVFQSLSNIRNHMLNNNNGNIISVSFSWPMPSGINYYYSDDIYFANDIFNLTTNHDLYQFTIHSIGLTAQPMPIGILGIGL